MLIWIIFFNFDGIFNVFDLLLGIYLVNVIVFGFVFNIGFVIVCVNE